MYQFSGVSFCQIFMLKVGSCPNDDNFVQIFFFLFLCSI